MSQKLNDSHRAMVRGIKNCGAHHEENKIAPAVQFAMECDRCAGLIFMIIYNAGVEAEVQAAVQVVQNRGGK